MTRRMADLEKVEKGAIRVLGESGMFQLLIGLPSICFSTTMIADVKTRLGRTAPISYNQRELHLARRERRETHSVVTARSPFATTCVDGACGECELSVASLTALLRLSAGRRFSSSTYDETACEFRDELVSARSISKCVAVGAEVVFVMRCKGQLFLLGAK